MTNDEAKAVLHEERTVLDNLSEQDDDPRNPVVVKALDIALWWAEQQKFVDAIVAAETSAAEGEAVLILMDWQGDHPRPGSEGT